MTRKLCLFLSAVVCAALVDDTPLFFLSLLVLPLPVVIVFSGAEFCLFLFVCLLVCLPCLYVVPKEV
jgi:hypothetical protein